VCRLAGLDLLSSTRTLPAQENLGDNAEAEEQGLAAVQREQQKEKEAAEEDLDWSDEEMEEVEYHELQGKARDIVPGSLYPTVALELNTKVPRSLRQAVLDKFLGETLRKHHFLHFALGQGRLFLPLSFTIASFGLLSRRTTTNRGRLDASKH